MTMIIIPMSFSPDKFICRSTYVWSFLPQLHSLPPFIGHPLQFPQLHPPPPLPIRTNHRTAKNSVTASIAMTIVSCIISKDNPYKCFFKLNQQTANLKE